VEIAALQIQHEGALADFVSEFASVGEEDIPAFLPNPDWSFQETVEGFDKRSRGEGLLDGWVPGTTRFLVHEGRILGLFNLRHRLTDNLERFGGHVGYSVRPSERRKGYGTLLLEATKELAREMKIERLLITCDSRNVASIGVIEKCGGVFEDRTYFESVAHDVCRYWISVI
jgi:predicted acetyltransferase